MAVHLRGEAVTFWIAIMRNRVETVSGRSKTASEKLQASPPHKPQDQDLILDLVSLLVLGEREREGKRETPVFGVSQFLGKNDEG